MPSPHLLLAFLATMAASACIPGQAMLYAAADLVRVPLASAVMARLGLSGRMQRLPRRAGGAVLIGLGTHLALAAAES